MREDAGSWVSILQKNFCNFPGESDRMLSVERKMCRDEMRRGVGSRQQRLASGEAATRRVDPSRGVQARKRRFRIASQMLSIEAAGTMPTSV